MTVLAMLLRQAPSVKETCCTPTCPTVLGSYGTRLAKYRDVLAAKLRVLGADHPSKLTTRHEIARMTAERGDHAGAEAE